MTKMEDRFWSKVVKSSTHWFWTDPLNPGGYGRFRVGGRGSKLVLAHRLAYELMVGPIAEGLVIDHKCKTTYCVNPAHLEPVTQGENVRRGKAGGSRPGYLRPLNRSVMA